MVYCGKASRGCENCRTRRIKCDKVRPDCSQCIRVGKKCPGYRDQLSLMFRDESSKVMQKAHAQWGVNENPEPTRQTVPPSASPPASSSSSSSSADSPPIASSSPGSNRRFSQASSSPAPSESHASTSASNSSVITLPPGVYPSISPNAEDQGVQFYVNRYLLGHPDEPKTSSDLDSSVWLRNAGLQDIMVAVGLAGLSNLKGDKDLMNLAQQRYGSALRQTGQLIQQPNGLSLEVTARAVVLLAMFELVKESHRDTQIVSTHVMGGAALIRSWCPMPDSTTFGGVRAMIQLLYSMFIHTQADGNPVAANFNDWVSSSRTLLSPVDGPAIDLGLLIARFIDLSAFVRSHVLVDGRASTASTLQRMLDLEAEFVQWEEKLEGQWQYRTETSQDLPPRAVFQGEYHVYYDLFFARMWNHYRWARLHLNQMILDFVNNSPMSGLPLLPVLQQVERYQLVQRLARDILVSTPSHWRHPLLNDKAAVSCEQSGGAGSGAAGVPVLLFHIKAAACAPGVPGEFWEWGQNIIECIWSDMGMLHARSMMDSMRAHRNGVSQSDMDGVMVPCQ